MSKILLGNCHTHSTLSDGREKPETMIRTYKKKGYDFIIMTDHRNKEKPYNYPDIPGIIVIEGCEVSNGEHYIYAEGETESIKIKNHPMRYQDPVSEVENWELYEASEHARLDPKYLQCRGNFPIISDDAHHLKAVGHAGILVDVKNSKKITKDAILKTIKEGKFRWYAKALKT